MILAEKNPKKDSLLEANIISINYLAFARQGFF